MPHIGVENMKNLLDFNSHLSRTTSKERVYTELDEDDIRFG